MNEIEDPGQWFSQHQADRFHDIVVAETGNKNIAREAGRYTASAQRIGAPKIFWMKSIFDITTQQLFRRSGRRPP
jgi:hypothetical protein